MAKKPLYNRHEQLQDKVNRHELSFVPFYGKPSAAVISTSQTSTLQQAHSTRQGADTVTGMSYSMDTCRHSRGDLQPESRGAPRVPCKPVFGVRKSLYSGLVNRVWRIVATGFCFAVFGMGGIVMALAAPVLLLILDTQYREKLARAIIHHWFRAYVKLMKILGLLIVEVRGTQKLQRQSLLILANHPSLIDVVILISLVKNCVCIVKTALWANPFTWAPVYLAGFIRNTGGPQLIDDAIRAIHAGNNLILFPEGTRTRPDQSILFKRGAANMIVRGKIKQVTPVVITCSEPTLTKGNSWYQIPRQALHFQLEVLDDLTVSTGWGVGRCSAIDEADEAARQVRNLTQYLQQYFVERMQKNGSSQ